MKLSKPTDDVHERICNAHWNGFGEGVKFLDIYQINACNHVLSGTIQVDDELYGFIIESGDIMGTDVKAWGDPEDVGTYEPPEQGEPLTLIPRNSMLFIDRPYMLAVYKAWQKEPWFEKLDSGYAYDRHFAPGRKTEDHYRAAAAKKGLQYGYLSGVRGYK